MSIADIEAILDEFRTLSTDERGKGAMFERLIKNYLTTDPKYVDLLGHVWLWKEWPGGTGGDAGIDLVAQERVSGDYWAIQCKFLDVGSSVQRASIDSFLALSGEQFEIDGHPHYFARRLIVTTTEKWSRNADAIKTQSIPITRMGLHDLAESPIDWTQFSPSKPDTLPRQPRKEPRPHQTAAIGAVLAGLGAHDRGRLIMACGTGKTFTSLRVAEDFVPKGGRVLFLAPSISLIAQTLREWTAEAREPIHALVVCSDVSVGRAEDMRHRDLAYPATTDAAKLAEAAAAHDGERRMVVFSTYHSIQVVSDAQKAGLGAFDLVICDEAHRTTGITLAKDTGDKGDPSGFVKVHDNTYVQAAKRLYMTATPRIYKDSSKNRADEENAVLYSMDDEAEFGPEFYRLGFGAAVEKELLSDYKVLIVAVEQERMGAITNDYNANAVRGPNKKPINTDFATKMIGSWKGLSKQGLVDVEEDGTQKKTREDTSPMRRAVAFSRTINASKQTTNTFGEVARIYTERSRGHATSGGKDDTAPVMIDCALRHVDGEMNAATRATALDWLREDPGEGKCRILSNARCLSEGIDVPALDSVVFFDTRESIVDIVQAVGRVMRKAPGKQYGYVILPVCIPSDQVPDYNAYIDNDPQFKGIWKVVKALRAHDESLVDEAEFRRKIELVIDPDSTRDSEEHEEREPLQLDFPALDVDAIKDAVYAAIPKKLGDLEYWSDWAKDIGTVAEKLIARINDMITRNPDVAARFDKFVKGLQDTLNPAVSRADAVEMLAQHILTMPVFEALFAGTGFPENNAVGKALEAVVNGLDAAAVGSETEGLSRFYKNVGESISHAKSDKSKQEIIRRLYDTFFRGAFPRMSERLGIVYTPVPVVDFILKSADQALAKHFGKTLSDKNVQILDPFTGTGTFLVRLMQSGMIDPKALRHKYSAEFHANEIVLLAYYIATVNIETAYHEATGEHRIFDGMVLTDTFQMTEEGDMVDKVVLPENNERAEHQLKQPIQVIIGNPPWSGKQDNANNNNENLAYPTLDKQIRDSYAARASAMRLNSLYDSYVRAIRWASDRIEDRGIVAFVSNGSFLDASNMDGLRKCLTDDFSHLYIFNLRGNARTQGEERRKEGGGIFDIGSRAPVAISIMVKAPNHEGPCELHYHDIGDYLKREEKFSIIEDFGGIDAVPWQLIKPNEQGDWANQRDPAFGKFVPIGDKSSDSPATIFGSYSQGALSARDAWAYNFSRNEVTANMQRMIEAYNGERERYAEQCAGKQKDEWPKIDSVIDTDSKRISWSRALKRDAFRNKAYEFESESIIQGAYRPYTKQWLYFNRRFNEVVFQQPHLFPTPQHSNIVMSVTGIGAPGDFSTLVSDFVPDYAMHGNGQYFPLYWYDRPADPKGKKQSELYDGDAEPDADGYVRRDVITDSALAAFRDHYGDATIRNEDIFWYIYGILHAPDYKARFAIDLKKMLPRIPFAADFRAFCDAGRALGEWHLGYETVEPWPLHEDGKLVMEKGDYRVRKMKFSGTGRDKDKSIIIYNDSLTLRDIPEEAYQYIVNGRPAIEWIMDRYTVATDKASGIVNDPNLWSDDPRYIVDLLRRIVRVSMETVKIVNTLPPLNEADQA